MTQPLSSETEKLLQDLQSNESFHRKTAAEELGKLNMRDERVMSALKMAAKSDNNQFVRRVSGQALSALGYELSSEEKASIEEQAQSQLPQPIKKIAGVGLVLLVIVIAGWLVYDNVGYWDGDKYTGKPVVKGDGRGRENISWAAHHEFKSCGEIQQFRRL